jgi:hypothetical protein
MKWQTPYAKLASKGEHYDDGGVGGIRTPDTVLTV